MKSFPLVELRIVRLRDMNLSNVYFVIGTSYAGKSTIVKNLAKKYEKCVFKFEL